MDDILKSLYSKDSQVRKDAVYKILFNREYNLTDDLKKAATLELEEDIAILMAQVVLNLETFVRDSEIEKRIVLHLDNNKGIYRLDRQMWEYLSNSGTSKMMLAILGMLQEGIPPEAMSFLEVCLNHADPRIRTAACSVAIESSRPAHFACVLNLVTDPDVNVSQTAFNLINNLPSKELEVMIDYCLSSSDEEIIESVAPFIPLLATSELKQVIKKNLNHSNVVVRKKTSEALRKLNFEAESADKSKSLGSKQNEGEALSSSFESEETKPRVISLRDKLNKKRIEREQEAQLDLHHNQEHIKEIQASESEIKSFSEQLNAFEKELEPEKTTANNSKSIFLSKDNFNLGVDDVNIEHEYQSELNSKNDFEFMQVKQSSIEANNKPGSEVDMLQPESLSNSATDLQRSKIETDDKNGSLDDFDLYAAAEQVQSEVPFKQTSYDLKNNETKDLHESVDNKGSKSDISINKPSDNTLCKNEADLAQSKIKTKKNIVATSTKVRTPASKESAQKARLSVGKPCPVGNNIIKMYPSFLSEPYAEIFTQSESHKILESLGKCLKNYIAFLNLCFLQCCIFYASPSDMINQNAKDCLENRLTGPTALRWLHNFAMSLRRTGENKSFFTFKLARKFTSGSDKNPLLLARELDQYLKSPVKPLEETLLMAIKGITNILSGSQVILNNSAIMKTPAGVSKPYANFTGPRAFALAANQEPLIELPAGEIVIISEDGSEALGLHPFFKCRKNRACFVNPSQAELNVLIKRLEL